MTNYTPIVLAGVLMAIGCGGFDENDGPMAGFNSGGKADGVEESCGLACGQTVYETGCAACHTM